MEQKKLDSLKEMTEESFLNRPEQAPEAIDEYFKNISESEVNHIKEKLTNSKYLEQFKIAITHTSLMVFIAAFKVTQNTVLVDFDKYLREFLAYAQRDDKEIYEMRKFYLSSLNADEIGIGHREPNEDGTPLEPLEENVVKGIEAAKAEYNSLIASLFKQYTDTKIHL